MHTRIDQTSRKRDNGRPLGSALLLGLEFQVEKSCLFAFRVPPSMLFTIFPLLMTIEAHDPHYDSL